MFLVEEALGITSNTSSATGFFEREDYLDDLLENEDNTPKVHFKWDLIAQLMQLAVASKVYTSKEGLDTDILTTITKILSFSMSKENFDTVIKVVMTTLEDLLKQDDLPITTVEAIVQLVSLPTKNKANSFTSIKDFEPRQVSSILSVFQCFLNRKDLDQCGLNTFQTLMIFLRSFTILNSKSDFNILPRHILIQVIDIMAKCLKQDPTFTWAGWDETCHWACGTGDQSPSLPPFLQGQSKIGIGYSLMRYLSHPSIEIRFKASEAVQYLFTSEQVHQDTDRLRNCFKILHNQLCSLCDQKCHRKEQLNRISTLLSTLGGLANNCAALVRESVTGILIFVRVLKIPETSLERVMGWLAKRKYPKAKKTEDAIEEYLTSMLGYILKEFLKESSLPDFPLGLMSCQSLKEFVTKKEKTIVPLMLWQRPDKVQTLKQLADIMAQSERDILVHNYPQIVAYILPFQANESQKEALVKATGSEEAAKMVLLKSEKIASVTKKVLTNQTYELLINENIPEVLSHVFTGIYDPEALNQMFGIQASLMKPNPPHCTQALAEGLIKFFTKVAREGAGNNDLHLFSYLVTMVPNFIERLIEAVAMALLIDEPIQDNHLRMSHGLMVLLDYVEVDAKALKQQMPFIVWHLCHTLLIRIEKSPFALVRKSCSVILDRIISISFTHDVQGVNNAVLVPLRNGMISLTQSETDQVVKAEMKKIMLNLVEQLGHSDPAELRRLGNFPSQLMFEDVVKARDEILKGIPDASVEETLNNFLKVCDAVKPCHLINPLENLLNCLSSKKLEMATLLKASSETTIFNSLIVKLVELASLQVDCLPPVAKLAAQCLGEVGACDLGTLVLASDTYIIGKSPPILGYLPQLLNWLMGYVTSPDPKTSKKAASAVKVGEKLHHITINVTHARFSQNVMASRFGHAVMEALQGELRFLLVPFKSEEALKVDILQLKPLEVVQTALDGVWIPAEDQCHEDWIIALVQAILNCCTRSCLLGKLRDICRLQSALCEKMLPILVHEILLQRHGEVTELLSNHITSFFAHHFYTSGNEDSDNKTLTSSLSSSGWMATLLSLL